MSEICGYSCEHNKNGICQISVCSKKSNMKDKTETELFRETWYEISQIRQLQQENKQLKDKLSKIEALITNHNCDTGDIYYKYNSKFLKSELKQRILEIVYEQGSDSDE